MPCRGWAWPQTGKKTIPHADDLPYPERHLLTCIFGERGASRKWGRSFANGTNWESRARAGIFTRQETISW